ncbi:hypothetical protein N865_02835 [Intrasporangium oryzae NRRL B-24470]|uniref:Uncharacterized protein n=1 Tax=Intrasporangium oryzae NRRL B-24470 TaxID=1386089 RepID=W9GCR3_9MICO|nr:hypothetical protein N865_02835 [Intrasporangium oryzae NRRL B-24470]
MTTSPPLMPPRAGDPIAVDISYVKRRSAENQANHWNEVLADDAVFGPASGFAVGVGARADGRYPLIWVPVETRQDP